MIKISCIDNTDWLEMSLQALRHEGFAVLADFVPRELVASTHSAIDRSAAAVVELLGHARLERAKELGIIRTPMIFDRVFYEYLQSPFLLKLIDATVSPTAIMHLQNAFALPSFSKDATKTSVFQNTFHQDFPRHLNGYLASINILIAIDEFTTTTGATLFVPGTHQKPERPSESYLRRYAIPVECPPGSAIVFDSTIWHAAGVNTSGRIRRALNHQFTRSFLKQQFDYVRAIGQERISTLPPRTQQLLGQYTRVVTSLDEYYQSDENRLYRSGQG